MTKAAKKLFSFLIKVGVLVLAIIFIYQQFLQKRDNLKHFQQLVANISRNQVIITLTFIMALMLVNWVLESLKWRYLITNLEKISAWKAIEAVFCGLTWAIFTPNRLGEYAGRVLFLPKRKRVLGVFAMAVGSFGQNVITNVMGLSACVWFVYKFFHINIYLYLFGVAGALLFLVFICIFYFHIKWLVNLLTRIPYIKRFHRFYDIMGRYTKPQLMI